jgi:hypothetical protein
MVDPLTLTVSGALCTVHPDGAETPMTVPEMVAPTDAAGAAPGAADEGAAGDVA